MQYTLKKSLGQHFLHNQPTCQQIVDAVANNQPTQLLEIGPGAGAITKYFLQLPGIDFKAVEIDQEKITYLLATYPSIKNKLIAADVLQMEIPFAGGFFVVGNFPYNISTEILFKLIHWRSQVQGCVGMFQKEVAERVAAPPGSKVYGVTSVLLQAFFKINYLFTVPPEHFDPPPKVDSGVIELIPLQTPFVNSEEYEGLRKIVKQAFSQRRKTLRNSLKGMYSAAVLENKMFDLRPEALSVAEFVHLLKLRNT
jgi:16S rRNA (adenine1518-N6/adenine1519-N6)-dimethyltransferase